VHNVRTVVVALVLLMGCAGSMAAQPGPLRFEVRLAPELGLGPQTGRLFVVVAKSAVPEPRLAIGRTGMNVAPAFARDVQNISATVPGIIDDTAVAFPIDRLSALAPGAYVAQAVLDTNQDLKSANAPGNLYGPPVELTLDPATSGVVQLMLTAAVPAETLPPDSEFVRFVKIPSKLLTDFHGRPIFLRAGVILPRDFNKDPARRFPLRVRIGGYGARFTGVQRMMAPGSEFSKVWADPSSEQFIVLHLDGDGPLGDPYQVDSDNHGPYGEAVTQELIPYIERTFRGIGEPRARVLDGGSTGGWVSLALQVFYPDAFNGAWSYCPDGVDFRGFQLVDIYADTNAYVNRAGFESPAARDLNGDVRMTMRHEVQSENLLGAGDSWTTSGGQWGAWNATYGPRGADGRPVPLWDPQTGVIDRSVVEHWKPYDLRLRMEQNWPTLGPKLQGKLHIWVGEADNFFLNNAVHMLETFLATAQPPYGGSIAYGPGKGHCWVGLSEKDIVAQMSAAVTRSTR
jgi:hypothetical protein